MDKLKELANICLENEIEFYINFCCASNNWWAETTSIYKQKVLTYKKFGDLDSLVEAMISEIRELN